MLPIRSTLLLALALVAVPEVTAQTTRYVTPRGAEFFDGNGSTIITFGSYAPNNRVQQVDANLIGTGATTIRSVSWRRDRTQFGRLRKTFTFELTMGHGDLSRVTSTWATNFKDTPRVVYRKKQIQSPDWSHFVPFPHPAELDFTLKLDTPFVYNGNDALVWDLTNTGNVLTRLNQDWQSGGVRGDYGPYPKNLGGGCAGTGGTVRNDTMYQAFAGSVNLGLRLANAPANAPVVFLIGATDPNLTLPFACGTLHVLPIFLFTLGTTNSRGMLHPTTAIRTSWSTFQAASLYTQAVVVDASNARTPLLLSNGLLVSPPRANGLTPVRVKRLYSNRPTSTTGIGPSDSAVPTAFGL